MRPDATLYPFAFPTNLRDRVVGKIRSSEDDGIFVQAQNRIRLERDCSSEIVACWYQHFAAAKNRTAIDGLLDAGGIFREAVPGGAEVADVEVDGVAPDFALAVAD